MIELQRVTYPTTVAIPTAHGTITQRHALLVGVSSGGHTGWTEVAPLAGFGLGLDLDQIETEIRAADRGGDVTDVAAATIEAARSDLAAQMAGIPLAKYLAPEQWAPGCDTVAVNANVSALDLAEVDRQVRVAVDAGYRAIKLKVAAADLGTDIRRITAAWMACGSAELRLDANQGWSRGTADEALRVAADHGVTWCEEPLADTTQWASLASHGVALGLDESLTAAADINTLLDTPGVGVVVLKPAVLGGPVATMRIALMARAKGMRVIITSFFDGPVGLAAAVHVAAACGDPGPHGVGTASMIDADFPAWLRPTHGTIVVPNTPGLGVDVTPRS
jgi:L-Ala-D/L-Glu epimerase